MCLICTVCCARAASGHVAAPITFMKSRRRIAAPEAQTGHGTGANLAHRVGAGVSSRCAVQLLRPRGLVHDDARPDFAIQQPLEVEAGKLIIRSFTNMRGEGGDGAGIARFQFGKCLEITLR